MAASRMKDTVVAFAFPIVVLLASTFILSLMNADLLLADRFFSPTGGWLWKDARPWADLYHYGNIPSLALALCGLVLFVFSFFIRRIAYYRKIGLFLIIYLAIGPGLVVNAVFKDNWGRPRPVEVRNFGGTQHYLPVWQRGTPGQGKSFPSGHAAVGYFMFAPFFFLRKPSPGWAWFFMLLGLSYGTLMGVGRMVQGGHFATDVLWAWGLVHIVGLALSYIFRFDRHTKMN